jgi:hypothetical protein
MKDLKVTAVSTGSRFVKAAIGPPDSQGIQEVKVSLALAGLSRSQRFLSHVIISTQSDRLPRARVPITAQYAAPVEIVPDSVVLDSDTTGPVKRQFAIKTSRASSLAIEADIIDALSIDCALGIERREHRLTVIVPECTTSFKGWKVPIALSFTNHAHVQVRHELSVPIYRFGKKGM